MPQTPTPNPKKQAQSTQRQIATQSSLKLVQDWGNSCNKCLTLKEIVAITNVIVDYVENGYSAEIGVRLENIQSYLDGNE
jgi:hypothetical protein